MTIPESMRSRLAALPPEKRELFAKLLVARSSGAATIPPRDRNVATPLAPPQRRLWFMDQLAPGSPVYNAVVAVHVQGRLDLPALHEVMDRIVARHEILRTVMRDVPSISVDNAVSNGSAASAEMDVCQVVLEDWQLTFEVVEVNGRSDGERLTAGIAIVRDFCREPYDLGTDLPLRMLVVELGESGLGQPEYLLGFAEHHIAFDGWSDEVMFRELGEGYAALVGGTPWDPEPLAIQYGDVAAWWNTNPPAASVEDYWRQNLTGAPPAVVLPYDRPHPETAGYHGEHVAVRIPGSLTELNSLRSQESATSFMILTAAFTAAIHRWSGTTDLVLGTPFANRSRTDFEPLIGFFSNTLPLRVRCDGGQSFRTLIRQCRDVCIGAFAHQELAFERIVELSRQPRDRRRNPLFQVNVRVQQGDPPTPELVGTITTPVAIDLGFSRFDLATDLSVTADEISGYVEYNSALFDERTIEHFIEWMQAFIADCLRRPDVPVQDLRFGPEATPVRGRRRRSAGESP